MYTLMLVLHLLGATVWVGGHLILAAVVLPRALQDRSVVELQRFESGYERLGIPALFVQVITGLWLAYRLVPDFGRWFDIDDPLTRAVGAKLVLLVASALLALDARLRVIPRLKPERLSALVWHVAPVTVISVLFLAVGATFRTGGLGQG